MSHESDKPTFSRLILQYWQRLRRKPTGVRSDQADESDVVQDVFLSLASRRQPPTQEQISWHELEILHKQRAIDQLRRDTALCRAGTERLGDREVASPDMSPCSTLSQEEQIGLLLAAIDSCLKPREAEVIRLHFLQQKSEEEIAIALNFTTRRVKATLDRAFENLLVALQPQMGSSYGRISSRAKQQRRQRRNSTSKKGVRGTTDCDQPSGFKGEAKTG